jgi:hypothetical protein
VTGKTYNEIMGYIQEIENDVPLKAHIKEMTKTALKSVFLTLKHVIEEESAGMLLSGH